LLNATGHSILDYNYRILDRMRQNVEEAVSNEIDSLRQRIKRLEEENEDLMNQVEMFNEVLDDS
ncbi:hypothetical protein AHAS_Ahas13G0329600, partial [Arachis hypogaea]